MRTIEWYEQLVFRFEFYIGKLQCRLFWHEWSMEGHHPDISSSGYYICHMCGKKK